MHCPKCGAENPDNSQTCNACGIDLKNHIYENARTNKKTSRLAIASLLLSFFTILTFLAGLISIALGIASLYRINKYKDELKGRCLAITGIAISAVSILTFTAAFILWSYDAAPIADDYTLADLRSAPPECADSYELLMSISEKEHPPDAPMIGLSAQDVNTIVQVNKVFTEGDYLEISKVLLENVENIKQAWENGKKGRDIINKLNSFPEIADLTEPDLEADIGFIPNIRLLVYLYQAYASLENQEGNSQNATTELIKLDSVFRKLSINARSMVIKLVCIAVLNIGINTANFIINNSQTSQESLELLEEHFTPLTNEQTSLRNSIIFEYLTFKNTLDINCTKSYCLPKTAFLKRNSTLRLYKNYCDDWIDVIEQSEESKHPELSVWPSIYPDLPVQIDSNGKIPWFYKAYNPIGSLIIEILLPAYDGITKVNTRLQIYHDLLQIILNKRLGKEVSLKARAYSDEYIIDVGKKMIFSPGPDGQAYTEDDIKLIINPEVLGLLQR